jgi:hypothetical protein
VLDEWAHQQWQAQIFAGAAPTASAGNQIIGLSSANGVGNEFHRQWELAVNGQGMHPIFLGWFVRPGRDQAWYDETTKTMEDWQRAQEFPATPEEAFILSGRPRFDPEALAAIARHSAREPLETIPLGQSPQGRALGHCRIWERPSPAGRYVIGADVAEGLLKGDYSAAVVLDRHSGVEVAELHGHWEPDEFARHLTNLGRAYGGQQGAAFLAVEKNNHGHAVLLALQTLYGYSNLYLHREYDENRLQATARPGWLTTTKSKPLMIDGLAQAIRERRPFRNALFLAEARTYTVKNNGETAGSGTAHDDRVMAYSIAEMLRHTHVQPPQQVIDLEQVVGPLSIYGDGDPFAALGYDATGVWRPPGDGVVPTADLYSSGGEPVLPGAMPPWQQELIRGHRHQAGPDSDIHGDDQGFIKFWGLDRPW